jgi:hypothetical protein
MNECVLFHSYLHYPVSCKGILKIPAKLLFPAMVQRWRTLKIKVYDRVAKAFKFVANEVINQS